MLFRTWTKWKKGKGEEEKEEGKGRKEHGLTPTHTNAYNTHTHIHTNRGVKPDQSVYNSLIRGLIFENKRKQNTKAVELFDKMTELVIVIIIVVAVDVSFFFSFSFFFLSHFSSRQGFSGDVDTFNSLLSG